ncbi:MAG: hypothetical protein KKD69_00265 [Euryarchaeota archaeon]|nr:hypothetical protein [Euryarchaeota archaeon]MBU4490883.1 hypothetical protein [Euryarchaeota archaeon]MCG2727264.1 hypothetical protein [Candidatus Methanoperedenaceae archaeon]
MLELIFGTRTKVKLLQVLAVSDSPMTRNELAKITHSGLKSTYEQVDELIALGVLKEIKNGRSRVVLNHEFPLYDNLRDLLLLSGEYLRTPEDILAAVDRICGDKYYIGAFTAARQRITPIDYDPPIYAINILKEHYKRFYPRLKTLGKLANIKVYENEVAREPGEITIVTDACEGIPPDVVRTDFLGIEVWIASVERGIVECLTRKTSFTLYGTYLVLLQNRLDNALDIAFLKKLAKEENYLPQVMAVMLKFNEIAGKEIFKITDEEKSMAQAWVDEKEVRHAINTVMG